MLALVGEGLSNDEIAERLSMSPATAKTHVNRSMAKLGARDRAQLVVAAYESGLVRPGWLIDSPRFIRPRSAAKHIDMLTAPTIAIASSALPSSLHSQPPETSERSPSSR